jgi:UDP-N-acetyl-D-mannosaminuronic acid transferase (WecB/TagA/CpsF family)
MTPEQRQALDLPAPPAPAVARDAASALPRPEDIHTRELLGLPIAMTDYAEAMDVMDGMVARRERGYVCAVAVHAVMVAQGDPEMEAALRGSTLTVPDGMPLVWAANMLGESLPNRVYGPERRP